MSQTADVYEPNDDMAMATSPAPHTSDCGLMTRDAVVATGDDVDVFRTGVCDVTQDSQPSATLTMGDASLRLCLILACDTGTTNVYSCGGDSPDDFVYARTDAGFRGCCRLGPGTVSAHVQCSGFPFRNHAVQGFIWIDANDSGSTSDLPYEVQYQMN